MRDDRHGAAGAGGGAAIIALVGDHGAGRGVRPEAQEGFEHRRAGLLAAGDLEGGGVAVEIGLQVNFRRIAAARAAETMRLAPLGAGRRDMSADHGAVDHLHYVRRAAALGEHSEERLEHPGPVQPREPFPDGVPVTEALR